MGEWLTPRAQKNRLTDQQIEEMRFMEEELHMPRKKIADELGCSYRTVIRHLGCKYEGCRKKGMGIDKTKMLELRAKGLSNNQIAIEMGYSYETVLRHIGYQPDNNRSDYGSIISYVTGESFVKEKEVRKLQQISMCVTFAGKDWTYEATDKGFVKISTFAGHALDLDIHQLENLMDELNEVHDWIKKHDTTPVIMLDGKPKSQEKQLPL